MSTINTYTAWCQEAGGTGTIWISSFDRPPGETLESLRLLAIEKCAVDWDWSDRKEDIHCLGIARGEIDLIFWEDIDEEGGPMGGLKSMEDVL